MTEAVWTGPEAYLDASQRTGLLGIARRALDGYLGTGKIPPRKERGENSAAPGAAFVTLTKHGRLRGCIGYTEAVAPLFKVVQECAVAAATEDPRFPPSPRTNSPPCASRSPSSPPWSPYGPRRSRSAGTG